MIRTISMKVSSLCYIQKKDKTLMIHRIKREKDLFKDLWNGVGGKAQEGESPEECAIREVKEETGLTISKPTLKGIITFPNNRDSGETWYVFVFLVKRFTGKLKENDEGILEWISTKEVSKLHIQDHDKIFIKWLPKDSVFSVKFTYTDTILQNYSVFFY